MSTPTRFNPFAGLRPFRSDENHLFFGREDQATALLQLLRQHRFLAVVGTSGSGKSSLVRAGLIPELHGGTMAQAGSAWEIMDLRPGGRPFENLAQALTAADLYDAEDPNALPRLRATLSRSRYGLVEAIKQSDVVEPDTNVLIVVDQFEELFRFRQQSIETEEAATAFVNLLLTASAQDECPIYVAITMRSDYLGDCSEIPGLAEAVNHGEYLIPRLQRDQKRDAIVKPIGVGGGKISDLLVQRLLNDIGDDPDQLPVLQHALMRMWDVWANSDHSDQAIDFVDLEVTGGLSHALSQHADEIYDHLPSDAHRDCATKLFKALTEKGEDNRGIRRPARLEKLQAITGQPEAMIEEIIEAYRKPGVTFLMPPAGAPLLPNTVIDISHESLMRVWRRLQVWVEDESLSARIYHRLRDTAELHTKDQAGLYHDPDLQIAQSWREQNQPNVAWAEQYGGGYEASMTFLEQSEDQARKAEREAEAARKRELEQAQQLAETQQEAARNFKRFAVGMGLVALVAVAAFVFALQKQKAAEAAESDAERNRVEATQAKENLRREFARSDRSLGYSFASDGAPQDEIARGIAYLSRSLEPDAEPNQPAVVDRIFNLLAYETPPGYQSPPLDFGLEGPLHEAVASADGSRVLTSLGFGKSFRLWEPGSSTYQEWQALENSRVHRNDGMRLSWNGKRLLLAQRRVQQKTLIDVDRWAEMREIDWGGDRNAPHFSFDGQRYLTGSSGQPLQMWDTESGELLRTVDPEPLGWPLDWSADGTKVVLYNQDRVTARVVDLHSGEVTDFTSPHQVDTAFLSPLGDSLLVNANPKQNTFGQFYLWPTNKPDAEPIAFSHNLEATSGYTWGDDPGAYLGEPNGVYAMADFTPDGQWILTAATDRTVRLWSAATGKLASEKTIAHQISSTNSPAFSTDGRRFMIRTRPHGAYVGEFDLANPSELPEPRHVPYVNEGFAFLGDAGAIKPLHLPLSRVISGAAHPQGDLLALGTVTGQVAIFNTITGELVGTPVEHPARVNDLRFNEDGTLLASRSTTGSVKVWTVGGSAEPRQTFPGEALAEGDADDVFAAFGLTDTTLAFSEDGSRYLDRNRVIHQLGAEAQGLDAPSGEAASPSLATFTEDGSLLAMVSGAAGSLEVWSTSSREQLVTLANDSDITSLAFDSANRLLAVGGRSGEVHLWELPSGQSADRMVIKGNAPCVDVTFSPDGRLLATVFEGGRDSYAQVWETSSGQAITPALANGGPVSRATFRQDGRSLVVWPHDLSGFPGSGIASVWDVSLSGGRPAPAWLPEIATSFGGQRLDSESLPQQVVDRTLPPPGTPADEGEANLARFYHWLGEFPGTRNDSPFRAAPSAAYRDLLSDASDLRLLNEAVRLRPMHARSLARRAVFRFPNNPAERTLSLVDLAQARILAPDDTELAWYQAIALDALGRQDRAQADQAYATARQLGPLDLGGLLAVIEAMERHGPRLDLAPRNEIFAQAIALTENSDADPMLAARLRVRRFQLNLAAGDFARVNEDWTVLKDLEHLPEEHSALELFSSYLELAETEATRLLGEADSEEAGLTLMRKAAVLSELQKSFQLQDLRDINYWPPTSALSLLVERENRQDPPVTLIEAKAEWDYLDDGSDQGTAWREPDFEPSPAWKSGPAKLGYGGDNEDTVLSWGPDEEDVHITSYFRHRFEVSENEQTPYLIVNLVRDDGAIVYLNGNEVLRDAMPDGEIDFQTPADELADSRDGSELRWHRLPIDPGNLRVGENILAAEVHQANSGSSDLGFQLELLGSRYSPGSHFAQVLRSSEPAALAASTLALVPRSFRQEWTEALNLARDGSSNSGDLSALTEESLRAAYRLKGMMEDWEAALALTDAVLQRPPDSNQATAEAFLRDRVWMQRKAEALRKLGRLDEWETVKQAAVAPPRNPNLDSRLVDISAFYTASLDKIDWHRSAFDSFSDLPSTFEPPDGTAFDLRGLVLFGGPGLGPPDAPTELTVPIDQKAQSVHLLTAAVLGDENTDEEVARLTLHFDDGSKAERPLIMGQDLADWILGPDPTLAPVVWRQHRPGHNGASRPNYIRKLSEVVYENPFPDKTIASLEITPRDTTASLTLFGITLR